LDVNPPQALVKHHTGGIALDEFAHGFAKELRPGLGLLIKGIGRHKLVILLPGRSAHGRIHHLNGRLAPESGLAHLVGASKTPKPPI